MFLLSHLKKDYWRIFILYYNDYKSKILNNELLLFNTIK